MNLSRNDNVVKISLRIYRWLIILFPEDFQEDYEYWIVQAFRDQLLATSSVHELISVWLTGLLDLLKNAVEERMHRLLNADRNFLSQNPRIHSLLWLVVFSGITAVSFYVYRFTILQGVQPLRALLIDDIPGISERHFIIKVLSHSALIHLIEGTILGLLQSLLLRRVSLSGLRWTFSTSLGWLAGNFFGYRLWQAVRASIIVHVIDVSSWMTSYIDVILQVLVLGLVLGAMQSWAFWKQTRQYYAWPIISVLAVMVYAVGWELLRTPTGFAPNSLFLPQLLLGFVQGFGILTLLRKRFFVKPQAEQLEA